MMERPILFSAPMVRALLDGTKTQTRRLVKGAPDDWAPVQPEVYSPTVVDRHGDEQPGPDAYGAGNKDGECWIRCPYGQPGDFLWVRETWREWSDAAWHYAADGTVLPKQRDRDLAAFLAQRAPFTWESYRWRPSIHMPRAASRLTLEVTGVRVERLHQISRGDAMAEGCPFANMQDGESPVRWYEYLWRAINGPDSWDANPWVWVVEFRKAHNVGAKLTARQRGSA